MKEKELINNLIDKSIEAFVMGLEIYNKPTIKYRIEGFSFFICNAWELMLKAELLKRGESIFYKDNPDRTISLENCLDRIYTNKKDPLRKNLTRIIHLRNISTHFITNDYELIYAPLFQACVNNFSEQMNRFHGKKLTDFISQNFLVLGIRTDNLSDEDIKQKYTKETAKKLLNEKKELKQLIGEENERFAIPVQSYLYLTKDKKKADLMVGVDKDADSRINIVKDVKDPNNIYPLTTKSVISQVNRRLKSNSVVIQNNREENKFNSYDFRLFDKFYGIKEDERYSFYSDVFKRYAYSPMLVDFIYSELSKDPEGLLTKLKKSIKK